MTKSFKRVAAVAALALGLGGLTGVASSHAAATPEAEFNVTAGALAAPAVVSGVAATASGVADGNHYLTVTLTQKNQYDSATVITSTGVGAMYGTAAVTNGTGGTTSTLTYVNGANAAGGLNWNGGNTAALWGSTKFPLAEAITFTVVSATAGTQVITSTPVNGTSAASTLTITWGAAPAISVGNTTASSFIDDGSTRPAAANATAKLSYAKTAGVTLAGATTGATIAVNVKDASNNDLAGQALTASITGPGLLTLAAGSGAGATGSVRSASLTAAAMTDSHATIGVSADGTSGTATITVSSGTTTLFTKTVTFYGTVATLEATQNLFIAKAGTTSLTLGSSLNADDASTVAKTPAVEIVAKDANGFVVPGLTVSAKSSDTTVIASGTVTEEDGVASTNGANGKGYYIASVTAAAGGASGASTTVVFRTLLGDGVTYVTSNPVTFTLGGSVSTGTITAAFASDSYLAGEKVSLGFVAKDSKGNAAYDGQFVLAAAATSSIAISQGTLPDGTLQIVNGKATKTFYAPIIGGTFTVSGYDNTTAGATAAALAGTKNLSVSTTIVGAADAAVQSAVDAAQEATDAANAAYDAANNAMDSADAATAAAQEASDNAAAALAAVTELATTVANLVAKVNSMAATIAKIAKKVKA